MSLLGLALALAAGLAGPLPAISKRARIPLVVGEILVGVLAALAGFGVAALAGTGHGLLYAVLLASSSAALVVPAVTGSGVRPPAALATVVHVAVADTVCIVALPLAEDPGRAGPAALRALAVIGVGGVEDPEPTGFRRLIRDSPKDMGPKAPPTRNVGPKVEACRRFVESTGHAAAIGSVTAVTAVLDGVEGTTFSADFTAPTRSS